MQHNTNGKTISIREAAAAALPHKKAVAFRREAARGRPTPAADRADLDDGGGGGRMWRQGEGTITFTAANNNGDWGTREREGGGSWQLFIIYQTRSTTVASW